MNLDLKLKILNKLSQSLTIDAAKTLALEVSKAGDVLSSNNEYDLLDKALSVLEVIGYRCSRQTFKIASEFINHVNEIELVYSEDDLLYEETVKNYKDKTALISKSINVLLNIRYLESGGVLEALIALTNHDIENVRKRALEGLERLGEFNINVFYGNNEQPGLHADPQKTIIKYMESCKNDFLIHHFEAVISLTQKLLSPTMENRTSTYKTVTFSQCAVPASQDVVEVRNRCLNVLKNIYWSLDDFSKKLKVIGALNVATRRHHGDINKDINSMLINNTCYVLSFYSEVVNIGDLEIIQKIENNSYWIYYHAISKEVEEAALIVESTISGDAEYQIYKTLVGYEGIFKRWEDLKAADSTWEGEDKYRNDNAEQYAASIDDENYHEWEARAIKYSKSRSGDLATFPVFYHFLEKFAEYNSSLALRFLYDNHVELVGFILPLFRGLWAGEKKEEIREWMISNINEGRYLEQSVRLFLFDESIDIELLKLALNVAEKHSNYSALSSIISVAVSKYASDNESIVDELLMPAIAISTKLSFANWIFDVWFRKQARNVLHDLSRDNIDVLLNNLALLSKIDYHAEEILFYIAERFPEKVFMYLLSRLDTNVVDDVSESNYEAIPYQLHKLNAPLSQIPDKAVQTLVEYFNANNEGFVYRGARLLSIIFPDFSQDYEKALLNVIKGGDFEDISFVLSVLRNYEGQPFLHTLCQEIIKLLPSKSRLLEEVAIVLQTTGVVCGQYGIAEAYEKKRDEVVLWLEDSNEKIRDFARWYIESLDKSIELERKSANEEIALRKNKYGE